MPYKIGKSKGGYKVFNKNTGKSYSKKPQTKEKAIAQLSALKINTNESFNDYTERLLNYLLT